MLNVIAALMAFSIVPFVGMKTGNKGLYITSGVALVTEMAFKQLNSVSHSAVKETSKKLGH